MMTPVKLKRRVKIRLMSDGKFIRFWPGGFGAMFPTGPYESIDEAMKPRSFFDSLGSHME